MQGALTEDHEAVCACACVTAHTPGKAYYVHVLMVLALMPTVKEEKRWARGYLRLGTC